MRHFLYVLLLMFLLGCGKSSNSTTEIIDDTTQVADGPEETAALNDEQQKGAAQLERFMQDFEVARDEYPSISFTRGNEVVSYLVRYYFENDNLMWVNIESSEEGGIAESYLVNRDPEGTYYLHYGTEVDGAFGYAGNEGGEWYKVRADGNYKPGVVGDGEADKFEYEMEFEEIMSSVRENMDKFKLKDGRYEYTLPAAGAAGEKSYQFSEVLSNSNLLSATRFNPEMIAGYLNWWYPLYEDASGVFYRHIVCTGGEDEIRIIVEAGNYRWEEEAAGQTIVYVIKGFEESEGDAFYATLERNGSRMKKTLVMTENDGLLMIDGRVYTSDPKRYDYVTLKCD